ncbi:28 kDa ribonucleoprotein, chloroplastic-like [Rhododendron vialii]|uniref:28 kDa ribonucleoprotein, chloroplastic-like n=1 Tax=Rhododendron vialii TaxID=182163 RepID=UPI00265E0682|nr:28 kDa ribonucleoprotein, chloroplastic-like [Rhododendron vialii]
MSCSVKPVYKSLLSSAPNGCLFSLSAIFTTTKTSSYQDLSKHIKIHLSLSHSKPPFPLFSTNSSRTHSSTTVSLKIMLRPSTDVRTRMQTHCVWSHSMHVGLDDGRGNHTHRMSVDTFVFGHVSKEISFRGGFEVDHFYWVKCYRETGESRGFGFINMSTAEEADMAIEMFHHFSFGRRVIKVDFAKEKSRGSF